MLMMRSKATHSAASLAFQSMWGLYLAGWMADQRLTGFRMASTMTMAGPTRWAIPTALTMEFLCSWNSCLVGCMADQTPTVDPKGCDVCITDRLGAPEGWLEGVLDAVGCPKAGLMVMMRLKAAHLGQYGGDDGGVGQGHGPPRR